MQRPDLSTMIPLPHDPAYLVAPDGRVYSHKKGGFLAERKAPYAVSWRVRVGHNEYRVRDLVTILHGNDYSFTERAEAWADANCKREEDDL